MRPVTAAIILSLAALAVFAVLSDGSDADGEFSTYDSETRILTITGDVPDCDITASDAPWSGYAYEVRTIVIGENVGYIGNNAFRGCTGVSTVTVIGSPTAGTDAFKGTGSTKQGFALDYKGTEIRDSLFSCSSGEVWMYSADLSSVRTIGAESFRGVKLDELRIAHITENVGNGAFSGSMVKRLVIEGNPVLGTSVFASCASLEFADIQLVTSIPESTFSGCSSLSDVQFSKSIVSVGNEAFKGSAITEAVFSGSLKIVGSEAFALCSALVHVAFTGPVDSIGDRAFSDCTALRTVEIQSVRDAGSEAFIGCDSVERAYTKDTGSFTFPSTARVYHDLPGTSADILIRYDFGDVGGECVLFSDTRMSSSYIDGSEGYRFIKWEDALGNTVADASSLTGSQTLTAVWAHAEGTEGTFTAGVALCVLSVICAATACAFCFRRA